MTTPSARACLFGGTLLAAGLSHVASAQEFVPTIPPGSPYIGYHSVSVSEGGDYQYSYGYAYTPGEAFAWDFDFESTGGWRATASWAPTIARISATTRTTASLFAYAYGTINAYFEVSEESTLRATWSFPEDPPAGLLFGRVRLTDTVSGSLLDVSTLGGIGDRTGDEEFQLVPDRLYLMDISADIFDAPDLDAFAQFELLPLGDCRADIDGDGELTIFDFLEFQNLFDSGDLAADFDGDGSLTLFDFLEFQNEFDAGC